MEQFRIEFQDEQGQPVEADDLQKVTGRVRWRESVLAMREAGVTDFVELGGKVLSPMIGRIDRDAQTLSAITMDDLETLAKGL